MNKLFKYKKSIIYILLILIIGTIIYKIKFQNDLFFDIKTGESIFKYGLDFTDHFSFIKDLPYLMHHWLYDIFIYKLFVTFSYKGISFLFLIIYLIFGIEFFLICKSYAKNNLVSFIVTLLILSNTIYCFQTRVQSITYILFLFEIYLLEKLYTTGNKKYSFLLIFISIIIVNVHLPLWILTIILTLPYILEIILYKLSKKTNEFKIYNPEKPKNIKIFIITIILILLSGMISPYKFIPYTFFIHSLGNHSYDFILEMKKTILLEDLFSLAIIFAYCLFSYLKVLKLKFRDFSLVFGIFFFSLIAFRNTVFFYIIGSIVLVKSLKIKINKEILIRKKINLNIIILSLIVLLFCSFIYKNIQFEKVEKNVKKDYPVKAVKYIKNNLNYKKIRLYNEFDFGSYLEYENIPVFIDSRAEVYIKEYNGGKDIIGDYLKALEYDKYRGIFKKYNIDHVLIYKFNSLYKMLLNDKDYKIIYEDKNYVLFEKVN